MWLNESNRLHYPGWLRSFDQPAGGIWRFSASSRAISASSPRRVRRIKCFTHHSDARPSFARMAFGLSPGSRFDPVVADERLRARSVRLGSNSHRIAHRWAILRDPSQQRPSVRLIPAVHIRPPPPMQRARRCRLGRSPRGVSIRCGRNVGTFRAFARHRLRVPIADASGLAVKECPCPTRQRLKKGAGQYAKPAKGTMEFGRAGLSKSDRALPTEVESHEGFGAQGDEERLYARSLRTRPGDC